MKRPDFDSSCYGLIYRERRLQIHNVGLMLGGKRTHANGYTFDYFDPNKDLQNSSYVGVQ